MILTLCSQTSTHGDLATTATFFVLTDGTYIHSRFNLYTTSTSLQLQQPINRVPTANITSRQREVT